MKTRLLTLSFLFASGQLLCAQSDPIYMFQHLVLPSFYYQEPAELRRILSKSNAAAYLSEYQRVFKKGMPDSSDVARIDWPSWKVRSYQHGDILVFVLVPPPPKRSPHCYLIGLLYPIVDKKVRDSVFSPGYYTLERGFAPRVYMSSSFNVLGSWDLSTGGGFHSNLGRFESKSPEKFAAYVAALATERKKRK